MITKVSKISKISWYFLTLDSRKTRAVSIITKAFHSTPHRKRRASEIAVRCGAVHALRCVALRNDGDRALSRTWRNESHKAFVATFNLYDICIHKPRDRQYDQLSLTENIDQWRRNDDAEAHSWSTVRNRWTQTRDRLSPVPAAATSGLGDGHRESIKVPKCGMMLWGWARSPVFWGTSG